MDAVRLLSLFVLGVSGCLRTKVWEGYRECPRVPAAIPSPCPAWVPDGVLVEGLNPNIIVDPARNDSFLVNCSVGPGGVIPMLNYRILAFTPPRTGLWSINNCYAGIDTRMAIMLASTCQLATCNDQGQDLSNPQRDCPTRYVPGVGAPPFGSNIMANLSAGTNYIVLIGGGNAAASGSSDFTVQEIVTSCPLPAFCDPKLTYNGAVCTTPDTCPEGQVRSLPNVTCFNGAYPTSTCVECANSSIVLTVGVNGPFPTGIVTYPLPVRCTSDRRVQKALLAAFVPPQTGNYEFSTCDLVDFDSVLAIIESEECGEYYVGGTYDDPNHPEENDYVLGCNDDGYFRINSLGYYSYELPNNVTGPRCSLIDLPSAGFASKFVVWLEAGTPYTLIFGSYIGRVGEGSVRIVWQGVGKKGDDKKAVADAKPDAKDANAKEADPKADAKVAAKADAKKAVGNDPAPIVGGALAGAVVIVGAIAGVIQKSRRRAAVVTI